MWCWVRLGCGVVWGLEKRVWLQESRTHPLRVHPPHSLATARTRHICIICVVYGGDSLELDGPEATVPRLSGLGSYLRQLMKGEGPKVGDQHQDERAATCWSDTRNPKPDCTVRHYSPGPRSESHRGEEQFALWL